MEITSLKSLKSYLGLTVDTDDGYLLDCIEAAEDWVKRYCNRPEGFASASRTEFIDGRNARTVELRCTPVSSLTAVDFANGSGGWTVYDPADFQVDAESGIVSYVAQSHGFRVPGLDYADWRQPGFMDSPSFPSGERSVRITYVGGYSAGNIPHALRRGVNDLAAAYYFAGRPGGPGSKARDNAMQSETLDRYSYQRRPVADVEAEVGRTLAPFRRGLT